jgi:signal transduction histidine kinase
MFHANQPFILIVDDNANNLSVLFQTLKTADYKVRMAIDGEDALAQIEHAHPELILLDVQMPNMDGFETCLRLQANPATEKIPIIFMTALTGRDKKLKGLSLGAVDYITKPFEPVEVLARVKIHWRLKQLTDTLEQRVEERSQALQLAQVRLVQQEKLSALGELVAGVAHEINNPISCIVGNANVLENSLNDLFDLINLYHQHLPQPDAAIENKLKTIDLDYLREDLPKLVKSMKDAGDRITNLSKSLRSFSRADSDQKQKFDLHEGIDSTMLILRHRLKANEQRPEIVVVTDYQEIPMVECFPGQINQVFMNIFANAIDALDSSNQGRSFEEITAAPNQITIRTVMEGNQVKVAIADNGPGIPDAVKDRIFDQLFTTKAVGKGTGLGLAIVHQIMVEKHGGAIVVNSEVDKGTEFVLTLPIHPDRP